MLQQVISPTTQPKQRPESAHITVNHIYILDEHEPAFTWSIETLETMLKFDTLLNNIESQYGRNRTGSQERTKN